MKDMLGTGVFDDEGKLVMFSNMNPKEIVESYVEGDGEVRKSIGQYLYEQERGLRYVLGKIGDYRKK